jgi:5'-3' exonuclease
MIVHLVDGTYELFRYFFALPSHVTAEGREVSAVRGVVGSVLMMLEEGATHVGVATDHIIESFRNDLWPGYKTGAGIDPALLSQFGLLEETLDLAGITTWPMVELEADDALAAAAKTAAADPSVDEVLICTPDKDLGQCVGGKVRQLDRRKGVVLDADGVRAKFGVGPESIPDYLALVGDSADGFPGLQGWGSKSAAAVLARYQHLEEVPHLGGDWDISPPVRNAARLAATLRDNFDEALLFRRIATVEVDEPVLKDVTDLEWTGPKPGFVELCEKIDALGLAERAVKLAEARAR